jgi:hypothetical protein
VSVEGPTKAATGHNLARNPVTLDFYYTTSRTAEVYLGSVTGVSAAGTYTVPDLPPGNGNIRIQTQGSTPSGQPESSQYSRTVTLTGLSSSCLMPLPGMELRAWKGVSAGQTSHDQIVAGATPVPDSSILTGTEPLWFTYTVHNLGFTSLNNVVVRDSFLNPVCVIPKIRPGEYGGCSREHAIT